VSGKDQDLDGLLFALLDVARHCMKHFEKYREEIPLTLRACRALLLVARYQGLNQGELAALADFDPAAFVRVLDRLESHGWIQRTPDPEDRRAHRIVLTERAKPHVSRIRTAIHSTAADALCELAVEERASMLKNLRRMRGKLSAAEPEVGFD
jgi:DNA-binding MarR family transcriptional regulator